MLTLEKLFIVIHFILSFCGTETVCLRAFSQEPFFVIPQHHGYKNILSSRSVFLRSGLSAQWIMCSVAWLQLSCAMLSAIIKRFLWDAVKKLSGESIKRFMWRVYVWSASEIRAHWDGEKTARVMIMLVLTRTHADACMLSIWKQTGVTFIYLCAWGTSHTAASNSSKNKTFTVK